MVQNMRNFEIWFKFFSMKGLLQICAVWRSTKKPSLLFSKSEVSGNAIFWTQTLFPYSMFSKSFKISKPHAFQENCFKISCVVKLLLRFPTFSERTFFKTWSIEKIPIQKKVVVLFFEFLLNDHVRCQHLKELFQLSWNLTLSLLNFVSTCLS